MSAFKNHEALIRATPQQDCRIYGVVFDSFFSTLISQDIFLSLVIRMQSYQNQIATPKIFLSQCVVPKVQDSGVTFFCYTIREHLLSSTQWCCKNIYVLHMYVCPVYHEKVTVTCWLTCFQFTAHQSLWQKIWFCEFSIKTFAV